MIWAGRPASNPGNRFSEIFAQIAILNDKLNDLLANGVDLRGVNQNWDKKLDSTNGDANGCNSDRFTCLWDNTVVRDNETGLVWEREPDTSTRSWKNAILYCNPREVGGRKGWHLPTVDQLASLVDSRKSHPALPTGHPFRNGDADFKSATQSPDTPLWNWNVKFTDGTVSDVDKILPLRAWCVRGGQSYDG